jgi:Ca2+-transporting ATPase
MVIEFWGLGESNYGNNFPKTQQKLSFDFKGGGILHDPEEENIHTVLNQFYQAGIAVKSLLAIMPKPQNHCTKQVGLWFDKAIGGDELMKLCDTRFEKDGD